MFPQAHRGVDFALGFTHESKPVRDIRKDIFDRIKAESQVRANLQRELAATEDRLILLNELLKCEQDRAAHEDLVQDREIVASTLDDFLVKEIGGGMYD